MADRNRGRRKPGRGRESGRDDRDRAFADRAQDEVRSWFGDEHAARRRHRDVMARGEGEPVARGPGSPLGLAYGDRGGGRFRRSQAPDNRSARPRENREARAAEFEPPEEYGTTPRGWHEPSYGYRPAAGYDHGVDPQAEPGWDARSMSGYGVQWRGRPGPPGPYAGRGPKGYRRTDARILEEVSDRLADAPDVDASDIEVAVHEGEVTISGTVADRWQKRRAEDVTDLVSGVREVHNRLRVARPEGS